MNVSIRGSPSPSKAINAKAFFSNIEDMSKIAAGATFTIIPEKN